MKFVFSTMSVLITEIKLGALEDAGVEQKLTNDLQPTTSTTPQPTPPRKEKRCWAFRMRAYGSFQGFFNIFLLNNSLEIFNVLFSFPLRILQLIMVHVASYLSVVVLINSFFFLIHSIDQRYLKASTPPPLPIPIPLLNIRIINDNLIHSSLTPYLWQNFTNPQEIGDVRKLLLH